MEKRYDPKEIESKWQQQWKKNNVYAAAPERDPFYILEMFPYPSGKLHMGHMRVYTIGDALARFWRMRGKDVMHPMGWDSFGLPAENAAIQEGIPPQKRTPLNIVSMKEQMEGAGFSYDWERELATSSVDYYHWNQWLFLKMYDKGLVYKRQSNVNWCPECNTVLANEQVSGSECWRGHQGVTVKTVDEWAFKITDYAQELLDDLDTLQEWPERITTMQRNWIGRSEGAHVTFPIIDSQESIKIFTTRVDTIYGCTFMSLAPEHPLAGKITTEEQKQVVQEFIQRMSKQDKIERTAEGGVKEGVFTGSYARNPYTDQKVPIYLANFVLAEYGTGAVMAVPAHDQRDFEFAKQYNIPIVNVIKPASGQVLPEPLTEAFTEDGILHDSGQFDELDSATARANMAVFAQQQGFGEATINWHLRDWGFSRQRYWGTPIPIVYCEHCGECPIPFEQLPVVLPDFPEIHKLGEGGGAPLSKLEDFVTTTCPKCNGPARREIETMDTFVDSSWYFARYLDVKNDQLPFSKSMADRYLPVDIYIGGPEHAVMHLLYFRFFTKVMRDLGLLSIDEPVKQLVTQGMVNALSYKCEKHGYLSPASLGVSPGQKDAHCPECGTPLVVNLEKMSKSKKNGLAPEELIDAFGADTTRLYTLFAAPPEKDLEWSDQGVEGLNRFMSRLYRLFHVLAPTAKGDFNKVQLPQEQKDLYGELQRTVKKVTEEVQERHHFNTAIAAMMELTNKIYQTKVLENTELLEPAFKKVILETIALILSPFAPHIAEEFWSMLGNTTLIALEVWPQYDEQAVIAQTITVGVQVNGKLRGELEVTADESQESIKARAQQLERVQKHTDGLDVKKVIYVPGRLVSIVAK